QESERIASAKAPEDLEQTGRPMPEELTGQPLAGEIVRVRNARKMLKKRELILAGTEKEKAGLRPDDITLTSVKLSQSRINEFAAHPRLDLFVAGESKHPAEKFGCTTCHSGQGSATEFTLASHTPNDTPQKNRWSSTHHWESNHFWDFPMSPKRFQESGCVKCHYHLTDLLPDGNKMEVREGKKVDAPGAKVVLGYTLLRENGCFGCHDIPGIKGGRWVGPDLCLEPTPPIDDLGPQEKLQAKQKQEPLTDQEKKDFEEATRRVEQAPAPKPLADLLKDMPAEPKDDKAKKEQLKKGRQLFTEKGCLACHFHSGTTKAESDVPAVSSKAHFGPDLSRLAAKLGTKPDDKASARRWLAQWIMDPKIHSPRTYMPVTHLSLEETTTIADWLLSQETKPVEEPP